MLRTNNFLIMEKSEQIEFIKKLDLPAAISLIERIERRKNNVNSELKSAQANYQKILDIRIASWFPIYYNDLIEGAAEQYEHLLEVRDELDEVLALLTYRKNEIDASVMEEQNVLIQSLTDKINKLEKELRETKAEPQLNSDSKPFTEKYSSLFRLPEINIRKSSVTPIQNSTLGLSK